MNAFDQRATAITPSRRVVKSGLASMLIAAICIGIWAIGCQAFRGEDGETGSVGPPGMPGLDGTTGQSAQEVLNTFPRYTCLGCITRESIQDEVITSRAMVHGAITRNKIADGAITAAHIMPAGAHWWPGSPRSLH